MRVLVTPDWYPWTEQPGYGVFCREQAKAASRFHDVVVLTWRWDPRLRTPFALSEANEDGLRTMRVRYSRLPLPRFGAVCKLWGVLAALRRLRAERWVPDVVHAHEYTAAMPTLVAARLSHAPLVISEHASDLALGRLSPKQRSYAERAFLYADVVCPVSADLARRIAPLVQQSAVIPVPNAVDTALFHPEAVRSDGPIRVLSVGGLVEKKGHAHLIDALPMIIADGLDAHLDVIGDGPLRSELVRRACRTGVSARVAFHGHLPRQKVSAFMKAADVFVLPSIWETMGCALAEAMASGVPCVVTDVGGTREVIDDRTGVLVAPESPAALAGGVATVIRERARFDPATLHALAVDRFGYDAVGKRWTEVYASVRAARGPRPVWREEAVHG